MKINKPASLVLLSGLAIRLGLAPFTGHPGDMALFVTSQRLYYQTGTIDLQYFPTLPTVYYIQLLFYAPYQLLRFAGVTDFQYSYNTTMMIEGLFLKLPMILCDAGIFVVLLNYTRRLIPATLFFLNPFPILLSAVWGTYDSMMLFPLIVGLFFIAIHDSKMTSSLAFVVSGLLKLFGFVTFALVVCETIIRPLFRRELPVEILGGISVVLATLLPVFFFGGYDSFLQVIVYRFIGLSSGIGGTHYGLLGELFNVNPSGILPTLPLALVLTCIGYSYESVKAERSSPLLFVKWTLVSALAFNLFSASEPQWLSWLVPLGILYGSLSGRAGLEYFAYLLGTVVPFLIITLLQGTDYMLVGTSAAFDLPYIEGIPGGVLIYAVMTTIMIAMFCGYFVYKKLRPFRLEVIPLVFLLYIQVYFWIAIFGIGRIPGTS